MNPESAAMPLGQYLKIAASLRGFNDAEGVLLTRRRQIDRIIARDLQKHAAVWAAFVTLSRRVKEARPEAKTCRDSLLVSHHMPYVLKRFFICVVHFNVGEQTEIVTLVNPADVRLQNGSQRLIWSRGLFKGLRIRIVREQFQPLGFEYRFFGRQRTGPFIFFGEPLCCDLALLDVWLIECVDADDRTGHSGRQLPPEKFLTKIIDIGHRDPNYRMSRAFQRVNRGIL